MLMFGVAIVIVLALGYVWMIRGFLSALLHMICTVVAGALAFGLWETTSHLIMSNVGMDAVKGAAWAIGLIVPFAVFTVLLRLCIDAVVRNNAQASGPLDYAGAGICGAITGTITAGIVVIGLGTTRLSSDFMGYRPLDYSGGSIQRTGGLLLPIDRLVGAFYAHTSEAVFATSEPLAKWFPDPAHMAATLRMTDGEGKASNTALPSDYRVLGSYVIGREGMPAQELLRDIWNNSPHNATTLEGEPYTSLGNQKLVGIWVQPEPTLKETSGDIIFGEGQIWMVAQTRNGERIIRHPVAVVSPADPASEGRYGRWRYDAKVFVALPGAAILPMAFEFVLPQDATPLGIFVKGARTSLDGLTPTEFPTTAMRDSAITSRTILPGGGGLAGSALDSSATTTIGADRPGTRNDEAMRDAGISVGRVLPMRLVLQKGSEGGLQLNDDNHIIGGENKFAKNQLESRGLPRNLMITQFGVRRGTALVQIEVSMNKPASLLGQAAAAADQVLPPVVVDDRGMQYQAIGWVYRDRDMAYIRYTPDRPIRGLAELQSQGVSLSRSRPDQELVLLFEVTENVNIQSFGIGGKEVIRLASPIQARGGRF